MRRRTMSLAVLAGIVLLGCEPGDHSATSPLSPTFDHKGSPHGNSGGGGGGASTYDLDITGSVLASESALELGRDNNRNIFLSFAAGTWNMTATRQAALDEIAAPANYDQCEFSPDADVDAKTAMANALLSDRVNGELGVNKRDPSGWIRFREQPDHVWSSWGFNTQTDDPGGAFVDADGTDWNDASAERRFIYSGGIIRVVLQPASPNDSGHDMKCYVQPGDDATIVLTPQ